MKVILLTDINKVGKKDQIVDVNDGYAKNYLIKNKLAVQVSKGSLNNLETRKAIENQNDLELKQKAIQLKNEIEAETFTFSLKTHENKVFGHISIKELLIEVNKKFPNIDKYMFVDKKHEWLLGKHEVKVRLYKDVIANINLNVIANNC